MFMNTKAIVLLFLVFTSGLSYAQDSLKPERIEKLTRAIASKDTGIRRRAIRELGRAARDNKIAQKLLMDVMFKKETSVEWAFDVVDGLSRCDFDIVKQIIERCGDANSVIDQKNLEKALFVFGRMGPKAKDSIPFLLGQMDKNKENPQIEGYIRIVLANAGYKSDENLKVITADINNKTKRGMAEVAQMARCGASGWVTDEAIKGLVQWLDINDINDYYKPNIYGDLFLAIASIGPRAQNAQSIVKKHIKLVSVREEKCSAMIMYSIALAKIAPQEANESVKEIMRCMDHPYCENFDHSTGYSIYISSYLWDDNITRLAGKYLEENKEPALLCGAIRMLGWNMGTDTQKYVPRIIAILKENPEEGCRETAATSLGEMADPCDVPQLEFALKKEKSETIQEEIAEATRIIRLEEKK
jgi:HEAT repeat protein